MLSNQYRILEALYPDEAEGLAETRDALERGYELHYDWNIQNIYDDTHVMSEEECQEVIGILAMFDALKLSYEALSDKSGIEEWRVKFIGFDGNNESIQLGYARYFCNSDGGRFPDLKVVNSHCPVLGRYRAMLIIWKGMNEKHELTKAEIIEIVSPQL